MMAGIVGVVGTDVSLEAQAQAVPLCNVYQVAPL